ncbi:TerD family protein [Deinococcus sp.]|uniref:TerD family protein n=1 Tax=Deinococcus sp. TaxID=47478 RepID=UPI0025BD7C10|nr:TerD family protein [Deinococcus sp.]
MQHPLQRGQRVPLTQFLTGAHLTLQAHLPGMAADISLLGLDEERKLTDDRYFIFYNQPGSPEGALNLDLKSQTFTVDLERVPLGIHHLLLAASSDDQTFSELGRGVVHVRDRQSNDVLFECSGELFGTEQAVMLLELYRHQGGWRISGVAQGFSGGLGALIQSLGGEVVKEMPTPESQAPALEWGESLTQLETIFGQPAPPQPEVWQPLTSAPTDPWHERNACERCGRRPGLGARLNSAGLCKTCAQEVTTGLHNFRTRFLAACADGLLEMHEWEDLQQTVYREKLDAKAALEFVRADALDLLERTISIAQADGSVSEQEEKVFERLLYLLQLPDGMAQPLRVRVAELRVASKLREGRLPSIQSTLILDAGEVAHLEVPATFRQVTATRTRDIAGRAVLTNRQMHFVGSAEGGWNVQYGKVLRIEGRPDGVNLELGVKKGSGYYKGMPQPIIFEAMLDSLVRMHKRLLLLPQSEKASRSIPQKVKLEVWQRDQGRCVECGDTNYLEYDHIIPHSLGGATSVGNLQLLCRRCNLAKSNRI